MNLLGLFRRPARQLVLEAFDGGRWRAAVRDDPGQLARRLGFARCKSGCGAGARIAALTTGGDHAALFAARVHISALVAAAEHENTAEADDIAQHVIERLLALADGR